MPCHSVRLDGLAAYINESKVPLLAPVSAPRHPRLYLTSDSQAVKMALMSAAFNNFDLGSGMLLPIVLGIVAHVVFKKFEPAGLVPLTALLGVVPAISAYMLRDSHTSITWTSLVAYLYYYAALLTSTVMYRLSPRHPMAKHPGPIMCKISKIWLTYIVTRGKLHIYLRQLHETYGPIVRIGPNEISVVDVELIPYILGPDGMPKGPLWDGRRIAGRLGTKDARGNMIAARDKRVHAEARRVWNRAFTPASVKAYEPIIIHCLEELMDRLKEAAAEEMVFSTSFNLLQDGDKSGLWHLLESALYPPALTEQIPWTTKIVMYLPFIGKQMKTLGKLAYKQVARRREEGSPHKDLFYHLMNEGHVDDFEPLPFPTLVSNAVTAIVAGSDTTATALSNVFYFMLSRPECYARLRDEIDAAFPAGEGLANDSAKLANMAYLNAVINEALRLYPSVITCLQRGPTAGSGGHMIGTKFFIPEHSAVLVPPYVLHRDPRYFSPNPDEFNPDRWLMAGKDENIVLNTNAYIPFSAGAMNCIGKPLALLEMRLVIVNLLRTFDFGLATGYNPEQWDADVRDYFVIQKGPLPAFVQLRQ
ncbi:cytochrome P450 [Laetiporus sulphureus 93-53]|uniref:Cytochrome P450 n=1 Tax=Laetiporus sulphureus 93-53 TaxID=1314785 RepID=A0A165HCR6_9APHY|nr:cytochrome P450 [Laetiporus sulphureus 93-53]KZT11556.1 cytochrome P450 [Laetiporus sulphureus 93-53]